jgi:sugar lactone lactonase YvrE
MSTPKASAAAVPAPAGASARSVAPEAPPRATSVWKDPEDQLLLSVARFTCGTNPKQVAFTPDGKELWVTLLRGHGIEVFDPLDGERLAQITLGNRGAVEIVFTRDGLTAYASQMTTARVYEIDRAARSVRRIIETGGSWTKVLALSADERTLFAANWVSSDVSVIDLARGRKVKLLRTVTTPRGLYPTRDGRRLFVAGYAKGEIQVIDLDTSERRVLLATGGQMRHMVADEAAGKLYVDDMKHGRVYSVNLESEAVHELATTNNRPNTLDLSPDGKVLYVSNRGKNGRSYYYPGPEWGSVLAIDTATGKVLDAIVSGNQTTGLDASPDGKLLAFSDFMDNRIRVHAVPDYALLQAGRGGRALSHFADLAKGRRAGANRTSGALTTRSATASGLAR